MSTKVDLSLITKVIAQVLMLMKQSGKTRVPYKRSHMHKIQRRNVWRSHNINRNKGRAENSKRNTADSNWRYYIFVRRGCRNKIKRNEKIINSKTSLFCGVFLIWKTISQQQIYHTYNVKKFISFGQKQKKKYYI